MYKLNCTWVLAAVPLLVFGLVTASSTHIVILQEVQRMGKKVAKRIRGGVLLADDLAVIQAVGARLHIEELKKVDNWVGHERVPGDILQDNPDPPPKLPAGVDFRVQVQRHSVCGAQIQ